MSKKLKSKNFSDKKKARIFSRAGDFLVGLTAFMMEVLKSPRVFLIASLWVVRNFCNKMENAFFA